MVPEVKIPFIVPVEILIKSHYVVTIQCVQAVVLLCNDRIDNFRNQKLKEGFKKTSFIRDVI